MEKKVVLALAILVVLGILVYMGIDIYRLTIKAILNFDNDTDNPVSSPGEPNQGNKGGDDNTAQNSNTTIPSFNAGGSGGGGGGSFSGGGTPAQISEITRSFSSSTLNVGEMLNVTINIYLRNSESYYILEDQIPNGFEILDSGTGNTNTPNYIKWIEYQNPQSTSYTYILNATQAGNYTFTGEYFIEGFSSIPQIGGENMVVVI